MTSKKVRTKLLRGTSGGIDRRYAHVVEL